jgi:mRNA interferase RelE/StbE
METIRYITNSKGKHSGLVIDFDVAKKILKKKKDLIELMEDIEDIVAVELSKGESKKVYEIAFKEKAVKQLSKIPTKFAEKIDELIQSLTLNPRPSGCKKLQGYENIYRVRYSDYRVLYSIEDKKLVIEIIQIGNRKEIYDKL